MPQIGWLELFIVVVIAILVIGPKDLPKAIVDQWAKAVQETMARKGWKKMVKAVGDMPRYMGPEEFSKHIASDFKRYRQMATDLDILVE